jgi:hypothetical protein
MFPRRRQSAPLLAATTSALALLLACGSPERPRCGDEDHGCVGVTATARACPTVTSMSIAPAELDLGAGGTSTLTAYTAQPGGAAPAVHWSAKSGTFGAPDAATTSFACAVAGIVVVTVTVTNGVCGDHLTGTITCLDVHDAGGE